MSLNYKILAAAIVSGLFATSAQAQVSLASTPTTAPVTVATEAFGPADAIPGAAFANVANALDIVTPISFGLSNGSVLHARVECGANVFIDNGSVVTYTDNALGTVALGTVNGLGSSAISFSVTATAAGVGDSILDRFTIDGTRTLSSSAAASCNYALYDQASQAQNGGPLGRINSTVTSGAYIASQSGYLFATNSQQVLTANVEAIPNAFTQFTAAGPVSAVLGRLTALRHDARALVQIDESGVDITLADIFGPTTSISVAGDFSFVAQTAAGVFLASDALCAVPIVTPTVVTAISATFTIGANARSATADAFLCVVPTGTAAIQEGIYTATLNAVVSNTEHSVLSTGPLAAGSIVRNGTSLQAPLAQVPSGWLSRIALTNTGNLARPYTITVFGETGNIIGTANLTGTVPANGTQMINMNQVLTSFTGNTRATVNVTIAGPNNQIQGLYQIVNPAAGSLSSYVMVRPGTN